MSLVLDRVRAVERSDLSSAWVSDHLVIPGPTRDQFPFSGLGMSPPRAGEMWLDAITVLSALAANTTRLRLGIAALVAGLRPVPIAARQVRTVHVLAGDRIEVGLAAGWLMEEFTALGEDPTDRYRRLDCWRDEARRAWEDSSHAVPPLLVAGNGRASRDRAAAWGDGWLPQQHLSTVDVAWLAACIDELDQSWSTCGRAGDPRVVLRLSGTTDAESLQGLVLATLRAGVDEVVVDAGWNGATIDPGVLALPSARCTT
ncbi:LLM class flavin-dependent oxidoreductase [Aquihabitans sp. G128]|nr:LLM class flavin-dependent oxidoreductase [Aquihabitans sp. G128]